MPTALKPRVQWNMPFKLIVNDFYGLFLQRDLIEPIKNVFQRRLK